MPPKAKAFLSTLQPDRRALLQTQGLLALKLPCSPWRSDGSFEWLVEPRWHLASCDDATWYMDGSMLYGKWNAYRSTGFGIAVVSKEGEVLGIALGRPPSWVSTAAAAEAWALKLVLELLPFPPSMRTDCLGLLKAAEQGTQWATAANRMLARIWVDIARATDGNITALTDNELLVWQPAHLSLQAVGERMLSNGRRMTIIDWRANRLVDALAKLAASEGKLPKTLLRVLQDAGIAVVQSAKLLGRVTFAANNFPGTVQNEDGTTSAVTLRDAQEAPSDRKRKKGGDDLAGSKPSCKEPTSGSPLNVKPWTAPDSSSRPRKRLRSSKTAQDAADSANLKRRLEDVGSRLAAPVQVATGAQRLALLKRRVGERLGFEPD